MPSIRILLVLLLAQTAARAQTAGASVEGVVNSSPSNAPLARVLVEMRSLDAGTARVFSLTTPANGRFVFRSIPPGRYQLTAMRAGFVRGDYGVRGPGASGLSITLAGGQRLTDVRLAMTPTGTIAGRITTPQGESIGNVHVKALRFAYQDGRRTLVDVKSVFTNDLGEYRLGWLPPGQYNVSAMHPDGTVNSLNQPEIINSSTSWAGTAVTNAGGFNGGSFNFASDPDPAVRARFGLSAGEDYVPIYYPGTPDQRSASLIDVRPGAESTGIDVVLTPIRTGTIVGSVVSATASPGTNGVFQVQVWRNPTFNLQAAVARSDPRTGLFTVSGLAPGSYIVTSAMGSGSDRVTGYAMVDVTEGAETSVQLPLERGIAIPARVVLEGANAKADLRALRVSLRTDPLILGVADSLPASPASDGSLTLSGIVAGEYIVNVRPLMTLPRATSGGSAPPAVPGPGDAGMALLLGNSASGVSLGDSLPGRQALVSPFPPAYVKSIRMGDMDLMNGRLRVERQPISGQIEIVISLRPGQVDGVVVTDRGTPARGTVVLVPDGGKRTRLDLYKTATTDAAGRFRITGITPDAYHLFAWDDVESDAWLDREFMQAIEGRGMAVRVAEGTTTTTRVELIR